MVIFPGGETVMFDFERVGGCILWFGVLGCAGIPCGLVDLAHEIDDAGVDTDVGETDGVGERGTI